MNLMQRRRALMAQAAQESEVFPEQEIGVNLIDTDAVTLNYKLDATTGAVTSASGNRVTDYIPVNPHYRYHFQKPNNREGALCWYDRDKTFISGQTIAQSSNTFQRTPPEAARYLRFSATQTGGNGTTAFIVSRYS